MPKAWSNKDERQYEHIRQSASRQGRSSRTAKRIAAATVNKQRSKEGRTKERTGRSASSRRAGSRSSRSRGGRSR